LTGLWEHGHYPAVQRALLAAITAVLVLGTAATAAEPQSFSVGSSQGGE